MGGLAHVSLRTTLALGRVAGTTDREEYRRWKRWYAEHRERSVDASADPVDHARAIHAVSDMWSAAATRAGTAGPSGGTEPAPATVIARQACRTAARRRDGGRILDVRNRASGARRRSLARRLATAGAVRRAAKRNSGPNE
jgi:hypothetical protein